MKYCTKCGKELLDEAVICPGCGCAVGPGQSTANSEHNYIFKLSGRIKINGIIWICVAAVQIIMAVTINWIFGIVGILNIISAINDLNYCKTVLTEHSGIIAKYEPITLPVITLIYNIIFGGIIGIAGSVYYIVGIRGYVLSHKSDFLKYDNPSS